MAKSNQIKTQALDLSSFKKEDLMTTAFNAAFELEMPVAIWRMPQQSEINLIIGTKGVKQIERIDFEELPSGFLFAPYNYGPSPALFISSDFNLSFDFDEVVGNIDFEANEDEALHGLKQKFVNSIEKQLPFQGYYHKPVINSDSWDYEDLVRKAISAIDTGEVDKLVPARSKHIELEDDFNLIDLFVNLCEDYPNAFVSLVSIPEYGTWLGATPEVLIREAGENFTTVALAGTQSYDETKSLSDTAWTQKEIEEQAMVSRFIINCFKKIRLREFVEKGPKTVKAGNLLHLKTTYEVNTRIANFPELATVMLELLHPTSAVAGMPKENALEFLEAHENLNREFFSGFLGPANIESKTNLFVNLRCMQLLENQAILYAGAGVTSDSSPSKEFEETEMKFNTLLHTLNKLR